MKPMNLDFKKFVSKVKNAQGKLEKMLKDQEWVEEARKYAEKSGKEVKKLFAADVPKVKAFLERERKELERIQKQIPNEVEKLRQFVKVQSKDLEKLLANLRKSSLNGAGKKKSKKSTGTRKKASTKKTSSESTTSSS